MYHTIWIISIVICFYEFYISVEGQDWLPDPLASKIENSTYSLLTLFAVLCPILNTAIAIYCVSMWLWVLLMHWEG
jgi:hypothetical protein